ncbi:hypothetical protein DFJ73DRAFT_836422, partial [Zopfochytrium polystomum]
MMDGFLVMVLLSGTSSSSSSSSSSSWLTSSSWLFLPPPVASFAPPDAVASDAGCVGKNGAVLTAAGNPGGARLVPSTVASQGTLVVVFAEGSAGDGSSANAAVVLLMLLLLLRLLLLTRPASASDLCERDAEKPTDVATEEGGPLIAGDARPGGLSFDGASHTRLL